MPKIIKILKKNQINIPKLGDVFICSFDSGEYIFGKIIYKGPEIMQDYVKDINELVVIYLYNIKSSSKNIDFSELTLDKILGNKIFITHIMYWQLGFFEIIGNINDNISEVSFPLCFELRHLTKDNYRDEKNQIIQKQTIYGDAIIQNISSLEFEISKLLGKTTSPGGSNNSGFNIFSTDAGSDFIGSIKGKTQIKELTQKIETLEYYKEGYELESYEAIECLCAIELLIAIRLEKFLEVDSSIFDGAYEFFEKNKGGYIDNKVFEKSKQLTEIIMISKTSELMMLRNEAGKLKELKKYCENLTYFIDKALNTPNKVNFFLGKFFGK